MIKIQKKIILLAAVFYGVSGLPLLSADPQPLDSSHPLQPEISASAPPAESGTSPLTDSTASFFDHNPLSGSQDKGAGKGFTLTSAESQAVSDLMNSLQISVGSSGMAAPPPPDKGAGSMTPPPVSAGTQTSAAKPEESVSNPVSFLRHEYEQVKKKMQDPDFETVLSDLKKDETQSEPAENEKTGAKDFTGPVPREVAGKVLVSMTLQVTDRVVKASEDFNLSGEHPFIDWLAMRGASEESKKALVEAEAQRKAMAQTAQEAEKNGNHIFFIVNGKIVPFFFNIPLFMKGEYQLYIADDAGFASQIPPQ